MSVGVYTPADLPVRCKVGNVMLLGSYIKWLGALDIMHSSVLKFGRGTTTSLTEHSRERHMHAAVLVRG